jgi:hypothetical protein
MMSIGHPFSNAYERLLEKRRLRQRGLPKVREGGFDEDEPPTLQEPVQATPSGTWRLDELDDPTAVEPKASKTLK